MHAKLQLELAKVQLCISALIHHGFDKSYPHLSQNIEFPRGFRQKVVAAAFLRSKIISKDIARECNAQSDSKMENLGRK